MVCFWLVFRWSLVGVGPILFSFIPPRLGTGHTSECRGLECVCARRTGSLSAIGLRRRPGSLPRAGTVDPARPFFCAFAQAVRFMQVARYELVPLFQACVCELRAGHVRKLIGLIWTKVFNIYSKSNGKMVHWRFLPFFPNDGAPERGSWVLFLRLRGHFSAFPFFSGTEACWRSTFSGLFVEDGDSGVLMGHVFRAFCARWGRWGGSLSSKGTKRGEIVDDRGVDVVIVHKNLGFCAWRGRHRLRAIARRLRRARVRGALCGGPPPRAAVACGGAGCVFCLGGHLARPGVISRLGPTQKPTPPEDNSAAGLRYWSDI